MTGPGLFAMFEEIDVGSRRAARSRISKKHIFFLIFCPFLKTVPNKSRMEMNLQYLFI